MGIDVTIYPAYKLGSTWFANGELRLDRHRDWFHEVLLSGNGPSLSGFRLEEGEKLILPDGRYEGKYEAPESLRQTTAGELAAFWPSDEAIEGRPINKAAGALLRALPESWVVLVDIG